MQNTIDKARYTAYNEHMNNYSYVHLKGGLFMNAKHNNHCPEHHHSGDCCHCEHHEHHHNEKAIIARLMAGTLLGITGAFLHGYPKSAFFIAAYLVFGYDVLWSAIKNIFRGRLFDENFLMSIATIGAFFLNEYTEAAAVMLFYQIGELLSHNAAEKSRGSISALMDIRPDTAHILCPDGIKAIACSEIKIGDTVIVAAGERIPIDGTVIQGDAMVDTSSLTGESVPRAVTAGNTVLAGMISTDGSLEIRADKEFVETTLSRILRLAEHAQEKKSKAERFITSFAKAYTPAVVAAAVIVAVAPPILGFGEFAQWLRRALTFLVISCPCALVVSVPLTFFAGIGCGSRHGILIKNGQTLENLAKVKVAAFDKTGTITEGKPHITEIRVNGSKAELLEIAAYAESDSSHPIAYAIRSAYGKKIDRNRISRISEIPARGIEAEIDGATVLAGSAKLLDERGTKISGSRPESAVYIAKNGEYMGFIGYGDKIKAESASAIKSLSRLRISSVMLSGDNADTARDIAMRAGISDFRAELMPQEKAEAIEKLKESGAVLFAGDGINDAPSLATADVGIAMGEIGADAAIESADAVIMRDELLLVPLAVRLSRAVMRIVRQNVAFSLGIKFAVMVLSLFGIGGMWPAIFADVGVCLIAVANAMRAFKINLKMY